MAYKKEIQARLEKLKKAKQFLEETHKLLKDVKYDVHGNTSQISCADEETQSTICFTSVYIDLVKKSKLWAFNNIQVPKEV